MKDKIILSLAILGLTGLAACGSKRDDSTPPVVQASQPDQDSIEMETALPPKSLFEKYGGIKTIQKVVDDAVTAELADPEVAPYFAVVGQPGHATVDRLKSCLDLQFTVVFGGPGRYPGVSHYRNAPKKGYRCVDMLSAHQGLDIPNAVFDKFISVLVGVLKTDGVTDEDIAMIAPAVLGTRKDIVNNGEGF